MKKQLAHHILVGFLMLFTAAGILGLLAWHASGLKIYSMSDAQLAPILQRGDLLVVKPQKTARAGDIVNFADANNPRGVVTRRLAQPATSGNLVGVTVKAVPLTGYVLDLLRRPAGLAVLVYVPAFIILRAELYRVGHQFGRQPYAANGFTPVMRQSSL
jgi:hypothetical protein